MDNKEEKARTLARNALREAVDHLDRVLGDPRSTDAQVQEALADKTTALSLYTSARFRADETNQRADFLTPAKEALQNTQAAVRTAGQAAADKIANLGLPEGVTFATTLPIHMVTEAADAALNLPIGAATAAQGIAGAIAHPIDTATGAAHLIDRAAQTTPEGRAFEFLAELSFGKYKTADEAARAFRDKTDGAAILGAKLDLTKDLAAGVFEESIKLAKEGRYGAALTNLFGENADVLLGIGPVRNLGRLERPLQIANDAEKAVKAAADAAKAVDESADLSKAVRTADQADALRRTPAGIKGGTIQPKIGGHGSHRAHQSTRPSRCAEYQARSGKLTYEQWSRVYEQNIIRATRANEAVDAYHRSLGWGRRELTVDVEGVLRRLDIGDDPTLRAREDQDRLSVPDPAEPLGDTCVIRSCGRRAGISAGTSMATRLQQLAKRLGSKTGHSIYRWNEMNEVKAREDFEYWLADMDDALERFLDLATRRNRAAP